MIQIYLNNELLDMEESNVVTFKKSQQLNGVQDLYSFSNNFNLKNSSKNRRLLKINYLPNSKAQSITVGYEVDVVFSGCIFLKRQKLKVQKETADAIPVYLIFTDNNFLAKAKNIALNQIGLGAPYSKNLTEFVTNNAADGNTRTAPISAQDTSGLVVVEEIPQLINIKHALVEIFNYMGYSYTGDILIDEDLPDYYMSPNVGVYGPDGVPKFADTLTLYDFLIAILKTFNGYIEVSDSSRSIGLYFWKNIETIKERFVDYSDLFVNFKEYVCDGGLAKVNTMTYADSPDFYNGFFDNNKSIEESKEYLNSSFGAGTLRLFDDQDLEEDGSIELRTNGEITEPQTINIFRFEDTAKSTLVYFEGVGYYINLYRAFSPNILEIWQKFHKKYCDNIALPTTGLFTFRYNAIFLSEFKMFKVFFIKQLSTYWLPLELNFTSKKEAIQIKCLMIEKSVVDVPEVFDFNISIDFFGEGVINDINLLYSALNVSPAATMIITGADLSKNDIFINGVQILAFPTPIDVSDDFEIVIRSIEEDNVKSNSDIFFQFVAENGGISRVATLNVAHNGRANYISEFRSPLDTEFTYSESNQAFIRRWLNQSIKVTTQVNIPNTVAPLVGDTTTEAAAITDFRMLTLQQAGPVTVTLNIGRVEVHAKSLGFTTKNSRANAYFDIGKNGSKLITLFTAGAVAGRGDAENTTVYEDVEATFTFTGNIGDNISAFIHFDGNPSGRMDGSVKFTNINWKFTSFEQV